MNLTQSPTSTVLCKANNANFLDPIAFSYLPSLQRSAFFSFPFHSSSFAVETIVLKALQKVTLSKAPPPLHAAPLASCNTSHNLILSGCTVKSLLTPCCQKQHINTMSQDPTILHPISFPVGILIFQKPKQLLPSQLKMKHKRTISTILPQVSHRCCQNSSTDYCLTRELTDLWDPADKEKLNNFLISTSAKQCDLHHILSLKV